MDLNQDHSSHNLRKSLTGFSDDRPSLPRKRSRSDTWSKPPTGLRYDSDAPSPMNTHCWQCGAALISRMASSGEKATASLPSQLEHPKSPEPAVPAKKPSDAPDQADSASSLDQANRIIRMKDAMLDATDIPVIALWHDGSLAVTNKAVARKMYFDSDPVTDSGADIISRYRVFTEDFSQELEQDEYPLVQMCRTQQPFSKVRVGLMDSSMRQSVYEVVGQCVYDEKSGEFQAAVCSMTDVTWYTDLLKVQSEQNEQNEQQFRLICETLPQIVWSLFCLRP